MKVVIEYVLLENMLINLICLKTCSLLLREKGRLFFLSAFFCACFTVVLPLLKLTAFGSFLFEIGLAILVVCISFKFKTIKKFLKCWSSYLIVTLIYGGGCYFVERYFGIKSTLIVLAIVVVIYFCTRILFKSFNRKKDIENFCFSIQIENEGQKTIWNGFLDTGNLLFDPVTNSPVSLVNFKVFKSIFKDIELMEVLTKSQKLNSLKFGHYITLNTLNNSDEIFVFQVDSLKIGEKVFEKSILGLSLMNFNEAFGCDIILHNNCA